MRTLRLGVAGLGRAFMLMLPTLVQHRRVDLVAAADPRPEARASFERDFNGRAYADVADLCNDPDVDAVYVASPHGLHVEHVRLAASHGKHVLVEKPMALQLEDCRAMIRAALAAGVYLVVGHSHSFDLPYLHTRALNQSGASGAVRMIQALNYTDFLYRPRRPEELDTDQGGGAVHNQAPHRVDVVRLLADAPARSIRATAGVWDPARPTEGAYAALIAFAGGGSASLAYSGYGRFDTDELCGWTGEMGTPRDPAEYGTARRRLHGLDPAQEVALKTQRANGEALDGATARRAAPPPAHNHSGFVMVSCERADLRPLPTGVMIYGETERRFEKLPSPSVPWAEVLDELTACVLDGTPPLHSGKWGLATTEICLAILASARAGHEITLHHQPGPRPA